MSPLYENRHHAGTVLASRLEHLKGRSGLVVLGLPRGGVPVAFEVARTLRAPLDVFLVRKLGLPGHRELAMGAIASGGIRVLNDDVVSGSGVSQAVIDAVGREELAELERRERAYRDAEARTALEGSTLVVVDDGLATGSTMRAAVQAVRTRAPARIVVAVPVGARETCQVLGAIADELVCALVPVDFTAVGEWYRDFSQTTDDEVRDLLRQARAQ